MATKQLTEWIIRYIEEKRRDDPAKFETKIAKYQGENRSDHQAEGQLTQPNGAALGVDGNTLSFLNYAAANAGQLKLVTHAAKFTHGDNKSSSIFNTVSENGPYLTTASLRRPAIDCVGNAAVADVAKLLLTEVDGDSLARCLLRQDYQCLASLASSPQQLQQWIAGFQRAMDAGELHSHYLAKQIYVPVEEGYHLLTPLTSSALLDALHQPIQHARFSEQSKLARRARKEAQWHPQPVVFYPQMAKIKAGGTKPQNVSYLNSLRGGAVYLLHCAPPQWQSLQQPPVTMRNFFAKGSPFLRLHSQSSPPLQQLVQLMLHWQNNLSIRTQIHGLIEQLIDDALNMAALFQQAAWSGWTEQKQCQLLPAYCYWLDPGRGAKDPAFNLSGQQAAWPETIAKDFALWLLASLQQVAKASTLSLPLGEAEKRVWQKRFLRQLQQSGQCEREEGQCAI